MGYEGHLVRKPDNAEKNRLVHKALSLLTGFAGELRAEGIPVGIVSAGGTGTYRITGVHPGITEVQAGSYCVMDSGIQNTNPEFYPAATVLTTIVSCPGNNIVIGDAGLKSFQPSRGMPLVKGIKGASVENLHAEHCFIRLAPSARRLKVGEKIELYVPYVDGTFNLHDCIHVIHRNQVVKLWAISGRCRSV
jgi:D-serine deaminase-like pyridoxal phosphate-dependent protein